MGYQPFTYKGKSYEADDKGHGFLYVTVAGDALKLVFNKTGITVEKLGFEELSDKKKSMKAMGTEIDYSYNLCVDCDGLKCNKDIVKTDCGNLKTG